MNRKLVALVMAALMIGCSSEWRTNQPTTPITYKLPTYRSERTVGNLMWLAILPVRKQKCGFLGTGCESQTTDPESAYEIATYLSEHKGYKVKVVVDEQGVWRPEVVVKTELGSIDELNRAWDSARSDDEISAAVKKIGAALQVDGLVFMWAEDEIIRKASPTAIGLAIVFFIPLIIAAPFLVMYGAGRKKTEAIIYEAVSGREVWRSSHSYRVGPAGLFRNLENAIPALVVR
jgi:hypothetical protein